MHLCLSVALLLHTVRFPVRWADVKLGHVNNVVFFAYFEQARMEWLDALLPAGWIDEAGAMVLSNRCDYRHPVRYPGHLVVRVYGETPGRTSFSHSYEVTVEGDEKTVYAEGKATLVWVSRATERPSPLPDALRNALPTETPA